MAAKIQVKVRIRGFIGFWIVVLFSVPAFAQSSEPTAQDILKTVRLNQSEQHRVLLGHLRTGGRLAPFRLVLDGAEISYEFTDPDQSLVLRLGEKTSRLEEVTKTGTQRISAAKFDTKVRGTDITYEDIALRFLYWQKAKIDGEETVLTRRCWKLHLEPASHADSQYSVVLLWVEKQSGAFLRADAFDWNLKLAKRFDVRSVQKEEGVWLLKQMRIERFEDGRSRDKTYLEIQGVEK